MQQQLGKLHGRQRPFASGMRYAFLGAALSAALVMAPLAANAQLRSSDNAIVTPVPGAPASFADLVARVKPSVVSIQVVADGSSPRAARSNGNGEGPQAKPFPDLPDDHPLNEFFRSQPRGGNRAVPQPRRRAQGSGFVITEDGYVVTNNHVVQGASKITVSFDEKENLPAKLIGTDPRTDLALLKIETNKKFPFVRFASGQSREGDWVVAVGNPFGLGGTVTAGIVSALARDIGSGPYDFLQIDAAVNRGNSGGPTFNMNGEVIGVNTAIYSPSGGNVGIAFAVPAATAKEVVEELKKSGTVKRGWLGVKIQTITKDMAEGLGLAEPHGALISELTGGGPAEKSGLRAGDAILSVDGRKIEDSRDLARKIADIAPGTTVDVIVRRDFKDVTVKVNLGTFPGSPQAATGAPSTESGPTALAELGLELAANPRGEGVLIADVEADSNAAEKGLRRGDIILEVNSRKVAQPADVDREVQRVKKLGRKAVLMTVTRGEQRRFVAVQFRGAAN